MSSPTNYDSRYVITYNSIWQGTKLTDYGIGPFQWFQPFNRCALFKTLSD